MKPWPRRVGALTIFELDGVAARRAARRVARLAAVDGAQRSNRRRFVARHAGAKQTGHRDRRDDADDRHDDQQLDQCEALGIANLQSILLVNVSAKRANNVSHTRRLLEQRKCHGDSVSSGDA